MKHKLPFLMAFMTMFAWGSRALADEVKIATAEDLESFAAKVNAGETTLDAVLTAPIELQGTEHTPIGTPSNPYCGHFDGANQAISHLNQMLFGTINGATLTRIYIQSGDITSNSEYAAHTGTLAGAVGTDAPNTITYCYSHANISGCTSDAGGFVGKMYGTISHCGYTGQLDNRSTTGGFIGSDYDAAHHTTLDHCFVMTDVLQSDAYTGSMVGWQESGVISDCYICTPCEAMFGHEGGTNQYSVYTKSEFQSGSVCYALNGTQDNIIWYQTIGEDDAPVPDPTHKQVYVKGDVRCDGTMASGYAIYTNEVNPKPNHTFVNGTCTVCGMTSENFAELSSDGFYLLGTTEQLEWFAARVNAGESSLNGRLTADLDYDGVTHTPIGSTSVYYSGTFDGGLHTIRNLESMLCGTISGATIENVILQGGAISQNGQYAVQCGTIAGNGGVGSASIIRNCYSSADLVGVGCDAGGIVGKFIGTIENCGYVGNLLECTSTASGISGSSQNGGLFIKNCFVGSKSMSGYPDYLGYIIGWMDSATITDCYVIENADVTNIVGNQGNNFDVKFVSADVVASGEVAFNLNGKTFQDPAWYQTLGQDAYPTLDPTHGVVYANGQLLCNGTPAEGTDYTFSNTLTSTVPSHNFRNGVCTICGTIENGFVQQAADGWYELATAANLEWFAGFVNNGNTTACARLTAAIDLDGLTHQPIGSAAMPYHGTFDGCSYPISNLNNMLFGTLSGATISRVNIVSGSVEPNTTYSSHLGSLAGTCTADAPNTITQCFSNADVNNSANDAGGLVGKYYGTMTYCGYTGRMNNFNTTGGLIGSDHSNACSIDIRNCFVLSDCIQGANFVGDICGWMHTGQFDNIYVCTPAELLIEYQGGSATNIHECEASDFASGEVCYALNGNSFTNAAWYQTLGQDEVPVLDETHGWVYQTEDGGYACQTDQAGLGQMALDIAQQMAAFVDTKTAYRPTKEAYTTAIQAFNGFTSREELIAAYNKLLTLQEDITSSAAQYDSFIQQISTIQTYLDEHNDELTESDYKEMLRDYFEMSQDPNDVYPRGTYTYILENESLNGDELTAEVEFVQNLLNQVMNYDPTAPREVTNLLTNADLSDGFNGWSGQVGNGHGTNGKMYAGEAYNAPLHMYQTLTDLPNGVYELVAQGAYRPYQVPTSAQQASVLYANDNQVYLLNDVECALPAEEAQDGVNCYITEGASITDLPITDADGNITAYALHGIQSCCYAFQAGRAVNRILVNVTDGTLTIGINTWGSGQIQDWTGFGNFRLFYRGESLDMAADHIQEVLNGQVARANTLLNTYEADFSENHALYPNFSAELRAQVQQAIDNAAATTDPAEEYALIQRFSTLFREVYDCKMAYTSLLNALDDFNSMVWAQQEKGALSEEFLKEEEAVFDLIWAKYIDGLYSTQEALDETDLRSTQCYQQLFGDQPERIDGIYQIASAANLQWFAQMVNSGNSTLHAIQTAPIDEAGKVVIPIGTPDAPFCGSYDGQYFPIQNQTEMLFGTLDGATITRVIIENGEITFNSTYANHLGSIAGACLSDAPNTITYCLSGTNLRDSGGDAGGLVGKMYGTIQHCGYYGSITSGNTVGGIVGSDHSDAYSIKVSNCFVLSDVLTGGEYTGALAGWQHSGAITDCYACAPTDIMVKFTGTSINTGNQFMTAEQFQSGDVCYMLNGQRSANPIWYQTLGQDQHPVLDSTHGIVELTENGFVNTTSVQDVLSDTDVTTVNVYDLQGRIIRSGVAPANSLLGLPNGIYVVGGHKFMVK